MTFDGSHFATWQGPARATAEEAVADFRRLLAILADHAPEFVTYAREPALYPNPCQRGK